MLMSVQKTSILVVKTVTVKTRMAVMIVSVGMGMNLMILGKHVQVNDVSLCMHYWCLEV